MKSHASMNRTYRIVWNHKLGAMVAVAENAKGQGKSGTGRKLVAAALSLSGGLYISPLAHAGPTGAQVGSGTGNIVQVGTTTTITQTSPTLSLNWQSFNIGKQETVTFVQPSASAVAINRIYDTMASQIFGNLNANGQVYLINPNGILFGQGAQVNVGALVASTLDMNAANSAGNARSFSGNSLGSIVNQGSIHAAPGGFVALLGHKVRNQGSITAPLGAVALGAGSDVTLTFKGNNFVKMQVNQSLLNSLAENGGLIQADGGLVVLTAGAHDALLASVVNNTGNIEARTVENHGGTITLLAGMAAGTTQVGGTLDASAPQGGDGGFIETSAAHVTVADGAKVSTAAPQGKTGTWLIDPVNFTIAATGGDITGAAVQTALVQNNFAVQSTTGDVNVNDVVSWSTHNLTLNAQNNINVNANLNATGLASLALEFGQGTASGNVITAKGAAINLVAGTTNFTTKQGAGAVVAKTYSVITDAAALRIMVPGANYALGGNIDLAPAAFTPIGTAAIPFSGTFDGLGHTISNLLITGGASTGMFAEAAGATIQNVGLVDGRVTGAASTGALVGNMASTTINNSYTQDIKVIGNAGTGGLVGTIVAGDSSINSSYAISTAAGREADSRSRAAIAAGWFDRRRKGTTQETALS